MVVLCPMCFRVNEKPKNPRISRKRRRGQVETELVAECEHCGKPFRQREISVSEIPKIYRALPFSGKVRVLGVV